jgi:hypothetical protein
MLQYSSAAELAVCPQQPAALHCMLLRMLLHMLVPYP